MFCKVKDAQPSREGQAGRQAVPALARNPGPWSLASGRVGGPSKTLQNRKKSKDTKNTSGLLEETGLPWLRVTLKAGATQCFGRFLHVTQGFGILQLVSPS